MRHSKFLKIGTISGILLCSFAGDVWGQTKYDSIPKQELGEVTVVGSSIFHKKDQISMANIEMHEKEDIASSLNLLPGVLDVHGSKSDQIYVRGFDQKQIPVYYDGIPIYIPYDGTIDLNMLMSTDVAKITVVKGAETMLYGPNALGGAINIITSTPNMGWSLKGKLGSFTNGKYNGLLSLGYANDKFFIKGAYAIIDKHDFRLPHNYKSTSSIEDGGNLDNSYKKTQQYSAKIGWTPAEGQKYVFTYVKHKGDKGIPPYLGTNTSARYWQFPVYGKNSYYFLSNSRLSSQFNLKTRLYYDKFDNTLNSYDDNTYSTQKKKYAFISIYDDYSMGAITTLSYMRSQNVLMFDGQYKYDNHKEHNVGEQVQKMEDESASLSLIDNYIINRQFSLHGGMSLNYQKGIKGQYLDTSNALAEYPQNSTTAYNGEISCVYQLDPLNKVRVGISYKTRFPTMKDRYSQSFGKSIPNPDLKSENALNYTLDYSTKMLDEKLNFDLGFYYSYLKDAILSVYGVDSGDASIYQLQNTGKAKYYGFDLAANYQILKPLELQANYSYVRRKNISNPDNHFTDVPDHSFRADLVYTFVNKSYVDLNFEAYTNRYTSSAGAKVDGFGLINVKGGCFVYKNLVRLEAGGNNIFDKNYQVYEGYPMPGRNGYVSVVVTL
jgi:iron complex outermembrane recepter protein